jgi:hypothetical protein
LKLSDQLLIIFGLVNDDLSPTKPFFPMMLKLPLKEFNWRSRYPYQALPRFNLRRNRSRSDPTMPTGLASLFLHRFFNR